MAVEIQIRRDTAADWVSANPTLASGEWGLETDTSNMKIGNGASVWTQLPYQIVPASVATIAYVQSASVNAAAVSDPRGYASAASTAAIAASDPRGYASAASTAAIASAFLTTQSASVATESYAFTTAQSASAYAANISVPITSFDVINTSAAPYSVLPGNASPEIGIQDAIDQANANYLAGVGPTTVYIPAGFYSGCNFHLIPGQTGTYACLWRRSGVVIRADGVTLQLAANASVSASANELHMVSTLYPYGSASVQEKTHTELWGMTIDGNAANQSAYSSPVGYVGPFGLWSGLSNSELNVHVTVKNIFGNSNSPPGETFHYEANNCKSVTYLYCDADGSGSSNTATGFSTDNSFDVSWIGCRAHNMGYGQGFTAWQSAQLTYTGCKSYLNGAAGFNCENSSFVTYNGCIAGGQSQLIFDGDPQNVYWLNGQTTLGNGDGWTISGSSNVTGSKNISQYNGTNVLIGTDNVSVTISESIVAGGTQGASVVALATIPPLGQWGGTAGTLVGRVLTLTGGTSEQLVVQSVSGASITFTSTIANTGHTTAQWPTLPRVCEGVFFDGNFRYSTGGGGLGTNDLILGGDFSDLSIASGGGQGASVAQLYGFPAGANFSSGATVILTGSTTETETLSTSPSVGAQSLSLTALPAGTMVPRSATTNPTIITLSGGSNPTESFTVNTISGTTVGIIGTVANSGHASVTWTSEELLTLSGAGNTANSTLTFTTNIVNSGRTLVKVNMNQVGCWAQGLYDDVYQGYSEGTIGANQQQSITAANPVLLYNTSGGLREAIVGVGGGSNPGTAKRTYIASILAESIDGNGVVTLPQTPAEALDAISAFRNGVR